MYYTSEYYLLYIERYKRIILMIIINLTNLFKLYLFNNISYILLFK